jgi:hypothetical protein
MPRPFTRRLGLTSFAAHPPSLQSHDFREIRLGKGLSGHGPPPPAGGSVPKHLTAHRGRVPPVFRPRWLGLARAATPKRRGPRTSVAIAPSSVGPGTCPCLAAPKCDRAPACTVSVGLPEPGAAQPGRATCGQARWQLRSSLTTRPRRRLLDPAATLLRSHAVVVAAGGPGASPRTPPGCRRPPLEPKLLPWTVGFRWTCEERPEHAPGSTCSTEVLRVAAGRAEAPPATREASSHWLTTPAVVEPVESAARENHALLRARRSRFRLPPHH